MKIKPQGSTNLVIYNLFLLAKDLAFGEAYKMIN